MSITATPTVNEIESDSDLSNYRPGRSDDEDDDDDVDGEAGSKRPQPNKPPKPRIAPNKRPVARKLPTTAGKLKKAKRVRPGSE
jgi:hypothetical protein